MGTETHDPSEEREAFGDMFEWLSIAEIDAAIDSTIARLEEANEMV